MSSIVAGIGQHNSATAVAAVADRLAGSLALPLILVHATDGAEAPGELLGRTEMRTTFGQPSEALTRIALEEDAALLVIGTGRNTGVRRLFTRSTASTVAQAESRPLVLVSPATAERERSPRPIAPSAIVCAIDESADAHRVADFAAAFAAVTLMRLVLVHDSAVDVDISVERLLRHEDVEIATREVKGRPSEWLEVIGAEENAGFAILGAGAREARLVDTWSSRPVIVVPPSTAAEAIGRLTHVRSAA